MPPLIVAFDAGILTLTLDRANQRNTLNVELVDAIHQALDRAELDATVRVVALRGAGEDFCAGLDFDELAASIDRTLAENEQAALRIGEVFQRLRELPKPVVAGVQGQARGSGAVLAQACDFVLAAESTEIGYAETVEAGHSTVPLGIMPAIGMTLLRDVVGEKLMLELALTGRILNATAALAAGLVTRVVSNDELDREVVALTTVLSNASGSALALSKALTYKIHGLSLKEGIALEARTSALARATPDFRTSAARFLRR